MELVLQEKIMIKNQVNVLESKKYLLGQESFLYILSVPKCLMYLNVQLKIILLCISGFSTDKKTKSGLLKKFEKMMNVN